MPEKETKFDKPKRTWCWFSFHDWDEWSKPIPHKRYDANADPKRLEDFLPIAIKYTQERLCKRCKKLDIVKLHNKEV